MSTSTIAGSRCNRHTKSTNVLPNHSNMNIRARIAQALKTIRNCLYRKAATVLPSNGTSKPECSSWNAVSTVAIRQMVPWRTGRLPLRRIALKGAGWTLGRYKPILQMLALALLCTTATSLVQEQKRVRGLETASDELRETLKQTRGEVQLLNRRFDAQESLQHSTSPRTEQTQGVPAGSQAPRRIGSKGRPISRVPKSQHPALQKRGPETPGPDTTPRTYRFSLSPSSQFRSVGPLKVLLRSINRSRSSVSLSATSNKTAITVQSLQLKQPIEMDIGNRQEGVELVIDQIRGNLVNGHVTELGRKDQPELRAELNTRP